MERLKVIFGPQLLILLVHFDILGLYNFYLFGVFGWNLIQLTFKFGIYGL